MDIEDAARLTGMTYTQVKYALRGGFIDLPASPGKEREFTPRALALLLLYRTLKDDKYRAQELRQAIDLVNANWDGDDPENAGCLLVMDGKFVWHRGKVVEVVDGVIKPLKTQRRFYYDLSSVLKGGDDESLDLV